MVIQFVLLTLTAMAFDGGVSSRVCVQAMLAYWLMVAWLALRRWSNLTKADVFLIRTGFFLWLVVAAAVEIDVAIQFSGGL